MSSSGPPVALAVARARSTSAISASVNVRIHDVCVARVAPRQALGVSIGFIQIELIGADSLVTRVADRGSSTALSAILPGANGVVKASTWRDGPTIDRLPVSRRTRMLRCHMAIQVDGSSTELPHRAAPWRCRLLVLVPVALAFAGCMVGPNYQRP